MKLHFDPNLDYQLQAIEAVCDLFRGQEICRTEFTVARDVPDNQWALSFAENDFCIGNRLTLPNDEILKNLNDIQLRNGLAPSAALVSGDFTVEMETGTGKTYVYLRTLFELNKRYGFNKFVIVVPSVAIKEGVYKSLQVTEEHFHGLYANTPYEYFIYDSAKPGQVLNFAMSTHIQIMIVTVGAINKRDVNNLYKDSERTGGERPIDLIKATRPILIVDEPQSVDGGLEGRGKAALAAMAPLCTLRYSATHVDKHHMVYQLDAVEAYERGLVKQIEVASASIQSTNNAPFVRLISVSNRRGVLNAKVELDVDTVGGVQRQEMTVQSNDDLEQITRRAIYHDCRIGEVCVKKCDEFLELCVPGGEYHLKPGHAWGDVDERAVQREAIRRTIKEHLDKEKRLQPQGIKVLSLFFIDEVVKYRQYDEDGQPVKGIYARIFEEEYRRLANHPDYRMLFRGVDLDRAAEEVHDGYFSIDRKKIGGKTIEVFKNTRGDTKADDSTFNLIMQKKESLLSFETPLKFIFSHSALREGWDNPNVFQICSLRDIQTERERRQTIGRGLRLAVNQNGERLRGFEVNTLTIIATESYEQFAENLQKEIEADSGIRLGLVEPHQFASIFVTEEDGQQTPLGFDRSRVLWEYFKTQGYIDVQGNIRDALQKALKDGTWALPAEFEMQRDQITGVLRKLSGRLEVRNADERKQMDALQPGLRNPEFKALWDHGKHTTSYPVQFDNEKLVQDCIRAVQDMPPTVKNHLQWHKADLVVGKAGVKTAKQTVAKTGMLDEVDIELPELPKLPDLLTDLQERTQFTRRTIQRILSDSRRLGDFKRNPQQFIEWAAQAINRCKRLALANEIKYQSMGKGRC